MVLFVPRLRLAAVSACGGLTALSQRPLRRRHSCPWVGSRSLLVSLHPQLQCALHAVSIPESDGFTLHGLCRVTTQACATQGAGLEAIKEQGTWTSTAMHAYVPKLASCMAP